jgi:Isochorismatase family
MQIDVIDPQKTAMIVVDMQNDFVASGAAMETPAARAMVPKLAEALHICRDARIHVIYTAHVHRRDGCDMGLFDDLHPPIANRAALVDGTPGVDIYPELAPAPGEHVIKKHRYSGFFGTDLDMILRDGVSTPSSSRERPPRIAATPRHGTRCFATTGSPFCRTRQRPMTTRTEALARCRPPKSTTPRW